MSFLNIFQKKSTPASFTSDLQTDELANSVSNDSMANTPPFDLFIDNEVPEENKVQVVETKNRIMQFLSRNFNAIGINEGFEYHSGETMDTGKKKIRAEFQLILDQDIQDKKARLLEMRHLIIDVKNLSESAKEKLELTIEELNASLSLLESQKELAALEEGWVMNAIHAYHQGFIQGLNDYIEGEQFLNTVKNF